jgi:hypothetical protein
MMKKIDFWKKEERESSGKRERRFGRWKNVMLPMKLKGKYMVWGEWGKGGAI